MRCSDSTGYPNPWLISDELVRKRIISMIALSCPAVLCVGIAGVMWRSGDHSAFVVSKYVALFGFTTIVVVAMGACTDFGPIRRASTVELGSVDGKDANIIPGSAGYFIVYQLILVCFAVMFLSAGAETAAAAWRTHRPLALLFTCLGLGSASAPALALVGKLRRGRIVLTSDEIIHDGWSSRTCLPWTDVSRVLTAFEQRLLLVITGSDGARGSHHATTPVVPLGIDTRLGRCLGLRPQTVRVDQDLRRDSRPPRFISATNSRRETPAGRDRNHETHRLCGQHALTR